MLLHLHLIYILIPIGPCSVIFGKWLHRKGKTTELKDPKTHRVQLLTWMADVWLCEALNGQKLAQIPCFSQTSLKATRVAFQIVHTHTGKQTAGVEGRVGGAITLYPEQHVTLICAESNGEFTEGHGVQQDPLRSQLQLSSPGDFVFLLARFHHRLVGSYLFAQSKHVVKKGLFVLAM